MWTGELIMAYEDTQIELILKAFHRIKSNGAFKSLTEYKAHSKLIRRWCFLNGCRSMDNEQGKHYSKNKLRRMRYDLH